MHDVLVVVGRLGPGLTDALVGPADLGPHPFLEPGPGAGVLLVSLAGVLPGDLPLLQVGEITAAVEAYLLLRQVEFQDPVHGALEKRAVVADQDGSGPQAPREPFQDLQPGDVQVVGRLVEQEDVVAGQQQRGQVDTGRLAAGQAGHRLAAGAGGQSQGGEARGGALL